MADSLTYTDTGQPVGTLANYSLSLSTSPRDPRDSTTAVPSFNVTLTDVGAEPSTLTSVPVTLTDWTGMPPSAFTGRDGNKTNGRVVAAQASPSSGLVTLDCATIFERLNTEQTTLPILQGETFDDVIRETLYHWCLMAGVPEQRLDGNLRHYISRWNTVGYMANDKSKWRFYGPETSFKSYVPTLSTYAPTLEVNPAQGITIGGEFSNGAYYGEFRIRAYEPISKQTVIYKLRLDNNVCTLREQVGTNPTTVLATATFPTPLAYNIYTFVQARVTANAASGKIDITIRRSEFDQNTQAAVFTDYTTTGVTSTLRNRPRPSMLDLGYDSAVTTTSTKQAPEYAFVSDAVLQDAYPVDQVYVNPYAGFPELDDLNLSKWPTHVPGFTRNVWDAMREFCAIYEMDISFKDGVIVFDRSASKRNDSNGDPIPSKVMNKANVLLSTDDREVAQKVEVKYRVRKPDSDNVGVIWKADTVYSLDKGETKVETIETSNTFINLNQPIPVSGVPVPYTSVFGSYVITGADGYIVSPQWWSDNGGSITVEGTSKSGEIKITMQAPNVDTTRAPYRVSEGVADRPALYITGYGLVLDEPVTEQFYTGALDPAQEVGVTFESPFITTKLAAINTGLKLAEAYGSGSSTLTFNVSTADYPEVQDSAAEVTPLNDSVYHKGSYYRVEQVSVQPKQISVGTSRASNPISVVNGEFANGKTVGDWNTLHANKTIRDTNMAPLPRYEG